MPPTDTLGYVGRRVLRGDPAPDRSPARYGGILEHLLVSGTHHDPRTTAALEKTKFGKEIERIKAIILALLVGRKVPWL